jgi:hypothetical protein
MKSRIDTGSEVATIGAWDSCRNDSALTDASDKTREKTLERDSVVGDIFLIHLGLESGGPIDVYVDSPIPNEALTETRVADRGFLLCLPSGRLVVAGVEDYRSSNPKNTEPNSVVVLPPGDYAVRCYIRRGEGTFAPLTSGELKAYFRRIDKIRLLGFAIVLLGLAFPLGWKLTVLVSLVVFLVYFYVQEEVVVIRRSARYRRLSKRVNRLFGKGKEKPSFILELRRIPEPLNLVGGSIRVDAAA